MTAEHGSFINGIGENSEGAKIFYPGKAQMGFGGLTGLEGVDSDFFAAIPNTAPELNGSLTGENGITPHADSQGGLFGRVNHDVIVEPGLDLSTPVEVSGRDGEVKQGAFERTNLALLNVIVQQRDEYSGISGLAANIEEHGMIHPLLVARYDADGARDYLVAAYGTYGKKVSADQRKRLPDLVKTTENGNETYYIVIAGHRRLRALRMLQKKTSILQIVNDIDPFEALEIQASENTAKLPKDYERAESNGDLHSILKARDPKLRIEKFATRVGHPVAVVRKDLRYYGLPPEVKNFVVPRNRRDSGEGDTEIPDQPLMEFNIACQLGRLVEVGASFDDILFLAKRFFVENITNEKTASRRVTQYIRDSIVHGGADMTDIFGFNVRRVAENTRTRQVAKTFIDPALAGLGLLERVRIAKENGFGGEKDDKLSFAAAGGYIKRLAELADELTDALHETMDADARNEIHTRLQRLRDAADIVAREYEGGAPKERGLLDLLEKD